MIFAVDPGPEKSAYAVLDSDLRPVEFGILQNCQLLCKIAGWRQGSFVVEMVASYGMAVGREVFETVFWIGRFYEAATHFRARDRVYRMEVKQNLCHDSRAKDANIRQALIDRFGVVGTKKNPGWFYGVSKDVWAAIAVGVTWRDQCSRTLRAAHEYRPMD